MLALTAARKTARTERPQAAPSRKRNSKHRIALDKPYESLYASLTTRQMAATFQFFALVS